MDVKEKFLAVFYGNNLMGIPQQNDTSITRKMFFFTIFLLKKCTYSLYSHLFCIFLILKLKNKLNKNVFPIADILE